MKFALVSDLHIDTHKQFEWDTSHGDGTEAPILVVAGDTANWQGVTTNLLGDARRYYETVVFTDGNHDHYRTGKQVHDGMKDLEEFADRTPGVVYLNGPRKFQVGDTLFIGATGWYDWKMGEPYTPKGQEYAWKMGMADSQTIQFGDTPPPALAFEQAIMLATAVEQAQDDETIREIVVVTHMIPHKRGLVVKPADALWTALNGSFASSELEMVWKKDREKKIRVWCFGHTHYRYDFTEGHIRFVSNPRGYPGENPKPYRSLVIDTSEPPLSYDALFGGLPEQIVNKE